MPERARWRFGLFILLFVPAVIMGNPLLFLISLLPVVQTSLASLLRTPSDMEIGGEGRRMDLWTGDKVKIERRLVVKDGTGPIFISLDTPKHIKLVEGEASRVVWKGRRPLKVSLDREITVLRRGMYHLGSAQITIIPLFGEGDRSMMRLGEDDHLLVHDRKLDMSKLRQSRILAHFPMPSRGVGTFGTEGTDFKDIRKYSPGDRYRSINWKATARMGDTSLPLVNQYEVEGRLSVLIMIDDGPCMGQEVMGRTALEHGVQAAQVLSDLYLSRDCDVALYAFSGDRRIAPAGGRRQGMMISRTLLELEVTEKNGDITGVIQAFPDHLRNGPLIVIVTSLSKGNIKTIERGLRELRRHIRTKGRVHIINIFEDLPQRPLDIDGPATKLYGLLTRGNVRRLMSLDARVIDWHPQGEPFTQFLLERFGGRGDHG